MFPSLFSIDETYNHFARLKTYVLEMCDVLITENPDRQRLIDLAHQFLRLQTNSKPPNFLISDPDNVLIVWDRNFSEMCSLMEKNGSLLPDKYSVISFYAKIDFLKKEVKRLDSQNR